MSSIRVIVLDVLKPHKPILPEFANRLAELPGIIGINISVIEIDQKTETIKLSIQGDSIDYETLKDEIEKLGGTVHSIDKVVAGKRIIQEVETPQDRS
ncbi:MAG TPA: DUF211 domain-containing protein [Methanofastidiosum sp.]|jgi:hypothetical protein|nr:DUF211 domain-containing protein [Methanofastidiosum sp.]HNZ86932.1 DUF211 domain-containing protein [Methanofastidiosum sp.]HOC77137.1 DUF211 domain-containing protein [Methanofastidiosum sp.]HOG73393.1 DUF211 domain-containing protein [Methanofastidiosum sp.]HPA48569.1 DUF211 domain-containing protein [Methanofastidiosum sp.]